MYSTHFIRNLVGYHEILGWCPYHVFTSVSLFEIFVYHLRRIACYNTITAMLQQLLEASRTHVPPTHSPVKPGPPSPPPANQNQAPTPKQQVNNDVQNF